MIRAIRRAAGLALAVLILVPGHARTKPTVDVGLEIKHYATDFTPEQRKAMGSTLAAYFAEQLTKQFGFLTFTSGAAQPQARLIIELRPPDGGSLEVGFNARIEGVKDAPAPIYWPFRAASAAGTGVEKQPAFVRAVQIKLDEAKFGDVAKLLAGIPIVADGSTLEEDRQSFLLKMAFEESELCMDQDTVLRVQHLVPRRGGFIPVELMAKTYSIVDERMVHIPGPVKAELSSGQDDLDKIRQAGIDKVVVRVFYVVDYQRFDEPDVCNRVISPEDAFGGGS